MVIFWNQLFRRTRFSIRLSTLLDKNFNRLVFPQEMYSCLNISQFEYFPEMKSCSFLLFPKMKYHLKRRHLRTIVKFTRTLTDELKRIPALR